MVRLRPEYRFNRLGTWAAMTETKALRRAAAICRAKAAEERAAAQHERELARLGGDTAGTHLAAAMVHETAAMLQSRLARLDDESIGRDQVGRTRLTVSRLLRPESSVRAARRRSA
jgi:hypothetical protein